MQSNDILVKAKSALCMTCSRELHLKKLCVPHGGPVRAHLLTHTLASAQAFIYALCQMAVRQNIVKALDLGPSRRMQDMQMPAALGEPPK